MPGARNELEEVDKAIEQLTFGASRLEPAAGAAQPKPWAFQRILVAVDGSERSKLAVDWARRIGEVFGSQVWAVHVVQPPDLTEHYLDALGALAVQPPMDLAAELEEHGREAVEDAAAALRAGGLRTDTILAHGRPVKVLADTANEVGADLVVLGSHSRGPVGRLLLGSVADGVKNHVKASVLIAKTPAPGPRLLLATDGSRSSKRAVSIGLRFGRRWKLPATVLHVFGVMDYTTRPDVEARERAAFERAVSAWRDPQVSFELELGDPAEQIVARARDTGAGLVVMGCRGLSGLGSLMAGSVSNRVAHEAEASVLLVKGWP